MNVMQPPQLPWSRVSNTEYTVTWRDEQWWLVGTPTARYPWLLTNRNGARYPIGDASLLDAQRKAEFALVSNVHARHKRTGE